MDEVPEQRGHAGEGERRDGQELPHAEVEVPAREVRVDERPKEVVVLSTPMPPKTSDSSTTPASTRLLEEEWARRGKVLDEEWTWRGGRCGAERDGGVGWSGAGA